MQTKRIGCKQKTKTCNDTSSNLDQLTLSLATSYKLQVMILKSWWTWLMGLIGLVTRNIASLVSALVLSTLFHFLFSLQIFFCLHPIFFCLHRDRFWCFVCIRSFLFASYLFCLQQTIFFLHWPLWATVRDKFIFIRSLRIDLNSCSFYTDCYREWILNTFTYFWCCLELFIEKFILNINNEHAQDHSCPG